MGCTLVAGAISLVALTLGAPDVDVQSLSGQELRGQVVEWTARELVVETPAGRENVAIADLLSVTPVSSGSGDSVGVAPQFWIRLLDGTQVQAVSYTVKDRQASVETCGGVKFQVPTRSIAWVRFRAADPAVDAQWKQITTQEVAGDVVVIRKPPASLDQLEGVLQDVGDGKVQFQFDDQTIPVGLEKLEGIVYFHRLRYEPPRPMCTASTRDGSSWNVKSLSLADDRLDVTTVAGVQLQLDWDSLRLLDFSSGNVVYLSDLEPETSSWTPFLESPLLAEKLARLYGPKRDQALDGSKLQLGSKQYSKGLAVHSRTELVYRLTSPYRRFQAEVGIDEAVGKSGHVELVVFGDDKELYRGSIQGGDAPTRLDLDITDARRLRILVDFGRELDIADHLNLCNARIIK